MTRSLPTHVGERWELCRRYASKFDGTNHEAALKDALGYSRFVRIYAMSGLLGEETRRLWEEFDDALGDE